MTVIAVGTSPLLLLRPHAPNAEKATTKLKVEAALLVLRNGAAVYHAILLHVTTAKTDWSFLAARTPALRVAPLFHFALPATSI